MKRYPLVYVLVLNWNGKELTIECVDSILHSDYPRFKVVVIDNGSTDGSAWALRDRFGIQIDVIENGSNLGYAQGFNVGLRYAFVDMGADFCLVMNNDTIIDSKAIKEMVNIAEHEDDIGFVTGKVYYYDEPDVFQTVGMQEDAVRWFGEHIGAREQDIGQYDEVSERAFADDVFTLIRKQLYSETGGYNPVFFLQSEETDWQARAKKLGYRIVYTPHAKLWHRVSVTLGLDSALKAFYDARNPMLVILLHKPAAFFRRYFWVHFSRDIARSSLVYLKQGRLTPALAKWQGLFSGIKWGLKSKRLTLGHFI
jgi:GT2 family glycosyltransferase